MKKKNLIIFGSGTEAIKMAPLVNQFLVDARFETRVCLIEREQALQSGVLDFFKIIPYYHLSLLKSNQNLYTETSAVLDGLQPVLEAFNPDYVFVNGGTTTAMAASVASFYSGAKVCHVGAGVRSLNKYTSYPEEMNRQITGRLSDFHFTSSKAYKKNLLQENVQWQDIEVSGNTAIDALLQSIVLIDVWEDAEIKALKKIHAAKSKLILVTTNCSENFGPDFVNVCEALQQIATDNPGVQVIYPVQLNSHGQKIATYFFDTVSNIQLVAPLGYPAMVWLLDKAYLILTDCTDLQEEVPSLGKPVLVLRENAERLEAVEAGTVLLVGNTAKSIRKETQELLDNSLAYETMGALHNPYGEGLASQKIINFIANV
jgi:UDP-N-acetylglucosamine 2-epimerase (non-hydrolysing)